MTPIQTSRHATSNPSTWLLKLVIWFVVFAPIGSALVHRLKLTLP